MCRCTPAVALTIATVAAPWHDAMAEAPVDTIVVTGTRVGVPERELPSSMTVIDRPAIDAANPAAVLDLLRGIPGLQVTQPGGAGAVASVFIRGAEPNFTMVLIDGIRVNDPNNTRGGSFDFSTLDTGDIERIEVVRGPQSSLYGSDALGGVVNVITRGGAQTLRAGVRAEGGEYGYRRGALRVAGPLPAGGGFALRVATRDAGEITPGNSYAGDAVNGKLSFGSKGAWTLDVFGRSSDNEGTSFPEDSGGPRFAVIRETDRKTSRDASIGIAASVKIAGGWRLDLAANRYDHEDTFDSPGVAPGVRDPVPPNDAASGLERSGVSVHATGELGDGLRATLGADRSDEQGTSTGSVELFPGVPIPSGFALDRSVTGAFGELRYEPVDALALLASLRRDAPDREPGETTARVGVLYDVNGGRTTLRANWGEGFKLPSFFALASPLVGNPELRAERSESVDVGVTQRFRGDALETTLTFYHNEFTDLIDFDAELFTNVNRRAVVARGAEISADYAPTSKLRLFAQALYLDLDIRDSDSRLRQRPEWRGSLALQFEPSAAWLLDARWYYVGETFDSSVPTGGVTLDGYRRLDATATWRASEDVDLVLSLDNLLDEAYEEAVGFPAPGRLARLGVRYRF